MDCEPWTGRDDLQLCVGARYKLQVTPGWQSSVAAAAKSIQAAGALLLIQGSPLIQCSLVQNLTSSVWPQLNEGHL